MRAGCSDARCVTTGCAPVWEGEGGLGVSKTGQVGVDLGSSRTRGCPTVTRGKCQLADSLKACNVVTKLGKADTSLPFRAFTTFVASQRFRAPEISGIKPQQCDS